MPFVYRSFLYTSSQDHSGELLTKYIRRIYENPALAQYIRTIDLRNWGWHGQEAVWQELYCTTYGEIHSPNTLGSFILSRTSNLRSLSIEYPPDGHLLNFHSDTIEELCIKPAFNPWLGEPSSQLAREFPIDGVLKVDFLPHVLSWPRLKSLCVEATSIFLDQVLLTTEYTVPTGTSSITELVLRLGNFDEKAISVLLRAPRALKSLTYVPPRLEDVSEKWSRGSHADQLPKTSTIGTTLKRYASTLEFLTVARAGSYWDQKLDLFGSLSHLHMLKSVEIDATMLLGWTHCSHIKNMVSEEGLSADSINPLHFGSMLPTNLECVTIRIERHPADQDGAQFVGLIAEGIAAEIGAGRLFCLRKLHFEFNGCSYCMTCENLEFQQTTPRNSLQIAADVLASGNVYEILFMSGYELTFG